MRWRRYGAWQRFTCSNPSARCLAHRLPPWPLRWSPRCWYCRRYGCASRRSRYKKIPRFAPGDFSCTVGMRRLVRLRQIVQQRLQEARGFTAGGCAMVEGERDRHAAMYFDTAHYRHNVVAELARANDRHARRHYDRGRVAAGEHAEVGQADGVAGQLRGRDRTILNLRAQALDRGTHTGTVENVGIAQRG